MPSQVGCGHRGANEPSGSLTLATRLGQPPRDPAPTFGDLQLHGAALVLILVSHGGRVAGARAAGAPGGAGYMAAPAGAGASWCRLQGRTGAGTASRLPAPRPESGGWNVTERGCGWAAGGGGRVSPTPGPVRAAQGLWMTPGLCWGRQASKPGRCLPSGIWRAPEVYVPGFREGCPPRHTEPSFPRGSHASSAPPSHLTHIIAHLLL